MADLLSRSEKKRIYKQVEELAREIATLSDRDLKTFPGGLVLHEEIVAVRGLKAGAKKRQIKYLAKLLRQGPVEEIYLYVSQRKGSQLHSRKQQHSAERMRDTLINEAMEAQQEYRAKRIPFDLDWHSDYIDQLVDEYPGLTVLEIRTVIQQYIVTHNKGHYRELFRMMKAAVEQRERLEKG